MPVSISQGRGVEEFDLVGFSLSATVDHAEKGSGAARFIEPTTDIPMAPGPVHPCVAGRQQDESLSRFEIWHKASFLRAVSYER